MKRSAGPCASTRSSTPACCCPRIHGLIFPRGYYLQTGELSSSRSRRTAWSSRSAWFSERRGLPVRLPQSRRRRVRPALVQHHEQKVGTPVICSGYSFFPDGTLVYFRADEEAKRHHVLQVWRTPYYSPDSRSGETGDGALQDRQPRHRAVHGRVHGDPGLVGREETYVNLLWTWPPGGGDPGRVF